MLDLHAALGGVGVVGRSTRTVFEFDVSCDVPANLGPQYSRIALSIPPLFVRGEAHSRPAEFGARVMAQVSLGYESQMKPFGHDVVTPLTYSGADRASGHPTLLLF